MPPPPPADLPLGDRVVHMVKTLQFAWFSGHLVLLLCIIRYSFSYLKFNYYSGMAQFSYRTAFICAAATYGIVVFKTLRARQRSGAGIPKGYKDALVLLSDENVQYLLLALIWLFAPQYPLAMLPYGIYSVFHVATYARANVIPTIQPAKPAPGASLAAKPASNPIADMIGQFVKRYYDMSMSVVSSLEILLWARILLSAVLFQRRSWILIVIYTAFVRARFSQSSHMQNSFTQFETQVDALVGQQGTPPAARQAWDTAKNLARQFYGATDLSGFSGPAAAPKKTS